MSLEAPEGGPAAPPAKMGDVANPSPDIMLPPFTGDNEESLLFSPEDGKLVGPPSLNLDLASLEQFLEPADSNKSQALAACRAVRDRVQADRSRWKQLWRISWELERERPEEKSDLV